MSICTGCYADEGLSRRRSLCFTCYVAVHGTPVGRYRYPKPQWVVCHVCRNLHPEDWERHEVSREVHAAHRYHQGTWCEAYYGDPRLPIEGMHDVQEEPWLCEADWDFGASGCGGALADDAGVADDGEAA